MLPVVGATIRRVRGTIPSSVLHQWTVAAWCSCARGNHPTTCYKSVPAPFDTLHYVFCGLSPDHVNQCATICLPQNVWTPENARQFWLSRESSLSYASLPSPEFSMRLSPIRVALKTQSLEESFWRLVFVGVCGDFL